MALSRGWELKSPIIIKILYVLEKKSVIPVKDPRNRESKSESDLYIDISSHFYYLSFNSKDKTCNTDNYHSWQL